MNGSPLTTLSVQRGDERRQLHLGDEYAIDKSDKGAGEDGDQDSDWDRQAGLGDRHRAEDAAEARHRADGQVDSAGQDHERFADGDDRHDRDLNADVEQVVRGQEVGGGDRQQDRDENQTACGRELGGDVLHAVAHPVGQSERNRRA